MADFTIEINFSNFGEFRSLYDQIKNDELSKDLLLYILEKAKFCNKRVVEIRNTLQCSLMEFNNTMKKLAKIGFIIY